MSRWMIRPASMVRAIAACALLGIATRPAGAQSGLCRAVDPPGASTTSARGINNAGDVAGWFVDGQGNQHGFVMTAAGQFTTLDVPGALWTAAFGINDVGQVVGAFGPQPECHCVADLESSAFVYSGGGISTFTVGLSETWPLDINNVGQIVGFYHDRDGDIADHERAFLMNQGSLTRVDAPGGGPLSEVATQLTGINDAGTAIGTAYGPSNYMFTWKDGQLSRLPNPPGATGVDASGINKAGKIVGFYGGPSSFVKSGKRYSDFNCPNAEFTWLYGANDKGGMVGSTFSGITSRGFYTLPVTFVDPVPDLISGRVLTSTAEKLGTKGREVQGAGADGAAVVLLRIPLASIGDPVTVTLLKTDNPQDIANNSDTDGALGTPDHPCCVFSVTATARDTSNGPMAFVTYRSPDDFPRPNRVDDSKKFREVFFRFKSGSSADTTMPLRLIRPPIALIHGLWDEPSSWDKFSPLVTGKDTSDPRFKVLKFGFDDAIGPQIGASSPVYPRQRLDKAKANSLGFRYNAERVLVKMEQAIEDFKAGANPEKISVAAVQFDVVAHSMGGDIVRTMPRIEGYLERRTFGQGIVHKLVTIDTPHTGSPVATRMLSTTENNACLRDVLAWKGNLAFSRVALGLQDVPGAVGDLVHSPPSRALQDINTPGPQGIFTALYAGVLVDFSSLDAWIGFARAIRNWCHDSPFAQQLTAARWPLVFSDDATHRNDGIVSHASQSNGLSNVGTSEGVLHSTGMRKLGFSGFVALDPGLFAVAVIDVLNIPRGNSTYYSVLNP